LAAQINSRRQTKAQKNSTVLTVNSQENSQWQLVE